MALDGNIDGLVTLPVNKEAIRLTSPGFSGHTGYIASLCAIRSYTMMLISSKLVVTHISTHVSLQEAIRLVKKQRVVDVIRLTHSAMNDLGRGSRIAVAGLNPHAGEGKAFGHEDAEEILPAVELGRSEGIDVTGPQPADTVFHQALKGKFDAIVCMYHDQGHIPMKMLDFESAVNVTLGLPIVRTSVDHGTAYDIAYQGIASTKSLINACRIAQMLSKTK
jgi:4-hydroxythreonine-4-phosphate dehydrogenase